MCLRFTYPGWSIVHSPRLVTVRKLDAPPDRDGDGNFEGYVRTFDPHGMKEQEIIDRAFATLEFLEDHERREKFEVNGVRVFDPHDPDVTGLQQDWFIEQQAAVRGY